MNKLIHYLFHNPRIILVVTLFKLSPLFSDKVYLKLLYYIDFGKKLNLKNPLTFNEKLQWLKLYDRRPEYTMMVDKLLVKDYVAKVLGEEYIIPTLGVWDSPDDIDIDSLPDQFVLKCNHDSGSICICHDKRTFDFEGAKRKLKKALKQNMYWRGREWPYRNVVRKVFAEKLMVENEESVATTKRLDDYKIFCFDGKPYMLFVASDRAHKVCFDYYDMDLKHLDLRQGADNFKGIVKLPKQFEKMKKLAAKISAGIPQVRTDFYEIEGKIYFGELTFFDSSGFAKFDPESWDEKLGELIVLPPPIRDM